MFLDVHTLSIREADIAFASELQRGDEPSAARSGKHRLGHPAVRLFGLCRTGRSGFRRSSRNRW
jgi:hypothetical protein